MDWKFWLLTYPSGIIGGSILQLFRLPGLVKIKNRERLPKDLSGCILASNHPSLWEPILLPLSIFFWKYLFHPTKYAPWSVADKENYFQKWRWIYFVVKSRLLAVNRKDKREAIEALSEMRRLVQAGKILIIFPEGGRTEKGAEVLTSPKGNRIRPLQNGVGIIAQKRRGDKLVPKIIPIWVSGSDKVLPIGKKLPKLWKETEIKIGKPIIPNGESVTDLTKIITQQLLNLADEN